jgi:26S proteasome regulatory subunit N3
VKTTFPE